MMLSTIQALASLNREIAMCIESARILSEALGREDLADNCRRDAAAAHERAAELRAQRVAA